MSMEELKQVKEMLAGQGTLAAPSLEEMRAGLDANADAFKPPEGIEVAPTEVGGVPGEWLTCDADGPVLFYLHGGGYVIGSPKSHRHMVGYLAKEMEGRALVIDYRLAPEHPFPAATDDALAAYKGLLDQGIPSSKIAVAGDSAGGGLTMATLLQIRDADLPAPACGMCYSPWVNLKNDGESFKTRADVDPMLSDKSMINNMSKHYAERTGYDHPLVSPQFADLSGLPPIMIQVGDHEVLLSDSEELNKNLQAAGVTSDLHVWDNMFHVWQSFWPMLEEGRKALDQSAWFMKRRVGT